MAKETTFFLRCCRLHRLLFDHTIHEGYLFILRDGFDARIDLADAAVIFTKSNGNSCIFFASFETRLRLDHFELSVSRLSGHCFRSFRNIGINNTSLQSLTHLGEVTHSCFFFGTWNLGNQVIKINTLLRRDFCSAKVFQRFGIRIGRVLFDQ